ncbi:urease isoform X1 [Tanacetum coccineum]|uniref:urease n=1 Tax=Tanacetum coccineum TaxID=301880 RepID=A0ABQ5GYP3_9ASTR
MEFLTIDPNTLPEPMKLSPREVEKLMLHNAGFLAQKRLACGLRLNYTEAVALIATQCPIIEGDKIPGELILRNGYILLNSGREAVILKVTNDGDRPIQVAAIIILLGSNPVWIFDRRKAILAEGDAKSVILVRIGGNEIADNFVNDANVKTMMESVNARGFGNSTDTSTTLRNQNNAA